MRSQRWRHADRLRNASTPRRHRPGIEAGIEMFRGRPIFEWAAVIFTYYFWLAITELGAVGLCRGPR